MSRRTIAATLYQFAEHWPRASDQLPDAYFCSIGLGEPSCYRCGWRLPALAEEAPSQLVHLQCLHAGPAGTRLEGRTA
jgi:hypothetical protein